MASEAGMTGRQPGFWDVEERLRELSEQGDPLEKLTATVDFEMFRGELEARLGVRDRSKGGRPPFDAVLKFRMLVLQAMHGLSLAQTEYLVADRLSWMRFCGLGPGDAVPDANTLWDFREALIAAGTLDDLFALLDRAITEAGYLPMAGQIVDATLVAAPRQRNTDAEKARIKAGESADEIWPDKPAKARQKGEPFRAIGPSDNGERRALDDEVLEGEAGRRRQAAGGHRRSGLRLQVAYLDRPPARHHPPAEGDRRGGA
jgi:transposase, IS5 family